MLQKISLFFVVYVFSSTLAASNTLRYSKSDLSYSGDRREVIEGSYKGWHPLELQVLIDPTFSQEQREILSKAAKLFLQRALSKDVLDCSFQRSFRGLPISRRNFEIQLAAALTIVESNGIYFPSSVHVVRYWDDRISVGQGYLNLFYDKEGGPHGFPYKHYFHVAINSDHLGCDSSYYYKDNPEYWAGVLAHQFLHNLGYEHPKDKSTSFVEEYERCIRSNG